MSAITDEGRRHAPPPVQPHPDRAPVSPARSPPPTPRRVADRDQFRLETACTECGAPVFFFEEDRSETCEYCGSLLVLDAAGEPVFHLPTRLDDPGLVGRLLAAHHAAKRRADIASRYADPDGGVGVPEAVIEAEIRRLDERYQREIQVHSMDLLHAPYRLCIGELGQAFLGRRAGGAKDVSFRLFALEYTLRGYHAEAMNLRDRGLKLHVGRLRLLTRRAAAGMGGRFLAVDVAAESPLSRAETLRERAQDRSLTPTAPPRGELLFVRECVVFKSFAVVEYSLEGRPRLALVDGSTEQVAGFPTLAERHSMRSDGPRVAGPFDGRAEVAVAAHASECPVCGNEQVFDPRARLQLCSVCNRALEVRADGIRDTSYLYAAADGGDDVAWVPFWRFDFDLEASSGRRLTSVAELLAAIWPRTPPPGGRGEHLLVPAVRCLAHATLDRAFARLAWRATHGAPSRWLEGPISPDTPGRRIQVSLDAAEARAIAPLVLYTLLDRPRRARLNVPATRELLRESHLDLRASTLSLIPLPVREGQVHLGDHAVALGFLERDPTELDLRQRIRFSL